MEIKFINFWHSHHLLPLLKILARAGFEVLLRSRSIDLVKRRKYFKKTYYWEWWRALPRPSSMWKSKNTSAINKLQCMWKSPFQKGVWHMCIEWNVNWMRHEIIHKMQFNHIFMCQNANANATLHWMRHERHKFFIERIWTRRPATADFNASTGYGRPIFWAFADRANANTLGRLRLADFFGACFEVGRLRLFGVWRAYHSNAMRICDFAMRIYDFLLHFGLSVRLIFGSFLEAFAMGICVFLNLACPAHFWIVFGSFCDENLRFFASFWLVRLISFWLVRRAKLRAAAKHPETIPRFKRGGL